MACQCLHGHACSHVALGVIVSGKRRQCLSESCRTREPLSPLEGSASVQGRRSSNPRSRRVVQRRSRCRTASHQRVQGRVWRARGAGVPLYGSENDAGAHRVARAPVARVDAGDSRSPQPRGGRDLKVGAEPATNKGCAQSDTTGVVGCCATLRAARSRRRTLRDRQLQGRRHGLDVDANAGGRGDAPARSSRATALGEWQATSVRHSRARVSPVPGAVGVSRAGRRHSERGTDHRRGRPPRRVGRSHQIERRHVQGRVDVRRRLPPANLPRHARARRGSGVASYGVRARRCGGSRTRSCAPARALPAATRSDPSPAPTSCVLPSRPAGTSVRTRRRTGTAARAAMRIFTVRSPDRRQRSRRGSESRYERLRIRSDGATT